MIRALIFDFDGLILDTEGPDYQAWQEIYQDYGAQLPLPVWADCIGRGHGASTRWPTWRPGSGGRLTGRPCGPATASAATP